MFIFRKSKSSLLQDKEPNSLDEDGTHIGPGEEENTVTFTDGTGNRMKYKLKKGKIKVTCNGKKQGIVKSMTYDHGTYILDDGRNQVALSSTDSASKILPDLALICHEAGIMSLNEFYPGRRSSVAQIKWRVVTPKGLNIRQTFSTKSKVLGWLKDGDIISERETNELKDEVWIRHDDGWCLANKGDTCFLKPSAPSPTIAQFTKPKKKKVESKGKPPKAHKSSKKKKSRKNSAKEVQNTKGVNDEKLFSDSAPFIPDFPTQFQFKDPPQPSRARTVDAVVISQDRCAAPRPQHDIFADLAKRRARTPPTTNPNTSRTEHLKRPPALTEVPQTCSVQPQNSPIEKEIADIFGQNCTPQATRDLWTKGKSKSTREILSMLDEEENKRRDAISVQQRIVAQQRAMYAQQLQMQMAMAAVSSYQQAPVQNATPFDQLEAEERSRGPNAPPVITPFDEPT